MGLIGYVRVSKEDQNLELQLDALKVKGCIRIFTDKLTGTKFEERKQLQAALDYLRPGDTLVVWKLDRLGRSLVQLILLVEDLKKHGIEFISCTENIDTTTAMGKAFFQFTGIMAELERNLIAERTKAGLAAARTRGRKGGRPKKLKTSQLEMLRKMYADTTNSVDTICSSFHITRSTLYRYVSKDRKVTAQNAGV